MSLDFAALGMTDDEFAAKLAAVPTVVADPPCAAVEFGGIDGAASCPAPMAPQAPKAARGHRKATAFSLRVESVAARFSGLPEGVTHHLHLMDTLKRAAPAMGLSTADMMLIDRLMARTTKRDWEPDSRPMTWVMNETLADELGVSVSAVEKRVARLWKLGVVVMRDSASKRRKGKRDAAGRIVLRDTFGFDLSPLAVRFGEFKSVAEDFRRERAACASALHRATVARRKVDQIVETAGEHGLWGSAWVEVQAQLAAAGVPRRKLSVAAAEAIALASEAVEATARAVWESEAKRLGKSMVERANIEGYPSKNCGPIYKTEVQKEDVPVEEVARREGSSCKVGAHEEVPAPAAKVAQEVERVDPRCVLDACPPLQAVATGRTWTDIGNAAAAICGDYGISRRTWREARQVLGPVGASVALAVVASLPVARFRRSPGAYFAGMIAAKRSGSLNLQASYWGMLDRAGLRRDAAAVGRC